MSRRSKDWMGTLSALVVGACCLAGAHGRAGQLGISQERSDQELMIYAAVRSVVDFTLEELLLKFPVECRDLGFDLNQAELDNLLRQTGERVAALYHDMPNTTSREQVRREQLDSGGSTDNSDKQSFNYLVLSGVDGLWQEVRTDKKGKNIALEGANLFLTSGFAGMSIFFHAQVQNRVRFRLLGRQNSAPNVYIVAFAQKAQRGQATGTFRSPGMYVPVHLMYQGFAWIDPVTYQILRMRIDLLAPRMDALLARQTTEIWFSEVHFNEISQSFWVPQEVVVTIDWAGHLYQNRHSYSDYLVFSVESQDKLVHPVIKK